MLQNVEPNRRPVPDAEEGDFPSGTTSEIRLHERPRRGSSERAGY